MSTQTAIIDPFDFFSDLDQHIEEHYSSDESDVSDEEDAMLASNRLMSASSSQKKQSRWFQLADQDDSDEVVELFDRLFFKEEQAAQGISQKESEEKEKEQERRMRQRSEFFETYSDDEEGGRLVVSHKKKRLDEMDAAIEKIHRLKEEKDWIQITSELKELDTKIVKKMLKMNEFTQPPKKYIKFMVDLREQVYNLVKDRKYTKELLPSQLKALQRLRSPLRNAVYLKKFQRMVNEYKQNKDTYNVEEDFGLEEEEEALRLAREKLKGEESDTDDSRTAEGPSKWLASDTESSSDDEGREGRAKWMVESDEESSDEEGKAKKKKRQGAKKKRKGKAVEETDEIELTDAQIEDKVNELRSTRGKRLLSSQEVIEQLKLYQEQTESDHVLIQVISELLSTIFDSFSSTDNCMSTEKWQECCDYLNKIMIIIESHPEIKFIEAVVNDEVKKQKDIVYMTGNACSLLEQLDSQFVKALKFTDPHTQEYVERLKEQYRFFNLAERVFCYLAGRTQKITSTKMAKQQLGRVAYRIFYHLHYRRFLDHKALLKSHRSRAQANEMPAPEQDVVFDDLTQSLEKLAPIIYQTGTEDVVNKTMLMHIYHLAVKNMFREARDLLNMSSISRTIASLYRNNRSKSSSITDVSVDDETKILYNRVIAQLGLCAFRCGQIRETCNTLRELVMAQTSTSLLLAQYVRHYSKADASKQEAEKRDRERQIPYHMHVNVELVDSAYIVSAMLMESSYSNLRTLTNKKKNHTFTLKKYFRPIEESLYSAPPDNTREHLYAANTLLLDGKWKECLEELKCLRMWGLCENKEQLLKIVEYNVKVECLRSYLFSNLKHYKHIQLKRLEDMFALSFNEVHAAISKMILNQELFGYLDGPRKSLNSLKEEPNELHRLAYDLMGRTHSIEVHNEQLADLGYSEGSDHHDGSFSRQHQVHYHNEWRRKYAF